MYKLQQIFFLSSQSYMHNKNKRFNKKKEVTPQTRKCEQKYILFDVKK